MRAVMRNLTDKARRLGGAGAVRNARLEVETASRTAIELDRQLTSVLDRQLTIVLEHAPPRAA
jgi:hypothetical protein